MSRISRTLATFSAGLVAAGMACTAMAAEPMQDSALVTAPSLSAVPYRIVQVADLNLANPAGVATLKGRITAAVRAVCGDADIRDLHASRDLAECRDASYADAMAQADDRIASVRVAAR